MIQIAPSDFQPKKLEEIMPAKTIVPDTYIIYSTGGYHPFYGISNTYSKYQLPIWPYVKRIKFSDKYTSDAKRDNIRRAHLRENHGLSQLGAALTPENRVHVVVDSTTTFNRADTGHTEVSRINISMHRAVALAWISNPEKKPFVLHLNDDCTNYLIENLKWGTASENNTGKPMRRPDTMEQKYQNLVNKGIIKG